MNPEFNIFGIFFLSPLFFIAAIFIPVILYYVIKKQTRLKLSSHITRDIETVFGTNRLYQNIQLGLIVAILIVFVLILADPHKANHKQKVTKNGIDIVLALDISKSMEATDLQPSRIIKAQEALADFIKKQTTNRVGLIMFAGKPISSVPLTFDYNILSETIEGLSTNSLSQNVPGLDGTAIGDALLMSRSMFQKKDKEDETQNNLTPDSTKKDPIKERKKVVILLTDGDANRGVDPIITSKLLAENNITVYTLGIGSKEGGTIVFNNGFGSQKVRIPPLNTQSLKEVAKVTGGYFFRATDNQSLEKIFSKLGELEKNDIEVTIIKRFSSLYFPFIGTILLLLIIYYYMNLKRPSL